MARSRAAWSTSIMVRIPLPRSLLLSAGLLLAPAAIAQTAPATPARTSQTSSDPQPGSPPEDAAAKPPAASASTKAPLGRSKKAAVAARRKGKAAPAPPLSSNAPIVTAPGFRMIEEGKSRVFLEVSHKVDVTERRAEGRVIYQLKGAVIPLRNSRLPLPTGFFSTPVGRIELVRQGDSAELVIELREAATPEHRVIETPRGIALQVDFPPPRGARPADPSLRRGPPSKPLTPSEGPSE